MGFLEDFDSPIITPKGREIVSPKYGLTTRQVSSPHPPSRPISAEALCPECPQPVVPALFALPLPHRPRHPPFAPLICPYPALFRP